MKNKFLIIITGAVMFCGCSDFLDVNDYGSTITEEQKKKAAEADPSLLAADVAAMNANMIDFAEVLGNTGNHYDFGYAAACLMMDCNATDITCANIGYNWFSPNSDFTDRVYTTARTEYMWKLFYKQIATANLLLANIPEDTEDADLKAYRGMGLAVRAFDYLHLAQLFQFTYIGHENSLCVPIVTDKTTSDEAMENPRASVSAVYELIMKDLTEAIKLLNGYVRPDKGYIDQSVAFGLRARANLIMNKWADAAADADSALVKSKAVPYTLAEISVPAFWNANDKTVLWANIITENNAIVLTSIINMPSHLCTFYTGGYVGVGAWKKINKPLYNRIASSDIRKQWWLNEDEESSLCSGSKYNDWRATASSDSDFGEYTNVKFGPDNNDLVNLKPAQDWFLMRAEEMIFIKAEGQAMSGNTPGAIKTLEDFIKANRNPSYACTASTPAAIQDEIWFQRRIELWGEGHSFFDIMRLKKPSNRIEFGETSFPAAWQFNIPAEDPILLWRIPQVEINANKGIPESDNNASPPPPVPTPI